MDEIYLNLLISKFLAGDLNDQEHEAFIIELQAMPEDQAKDVLERCGTYLLQENDGVSSRHTELEQRIEVLLDQADDLQVNGASDTSEPTVKGNQRLWKYTGVAAAILLISFTVFLYAKRDRQLPVQTTARQNQPVVPGGNKATLTLAGGERIILSNSTNGRLAKESAVGIDKVRDGELAYHQLDAQSPPENQEVGLNVLSTPKGGKYTITLPDGSRVWLNASTTLTFPTLFKGKTREVTITGEAYFEVAKNKAMPFLVNVNHTQVKVLGTHFNVMGYPDESTVQTTLLEGSVAVSKDKETQLISPGQQARVTPGTSTGSSIKISHVDTAQVVGWKNGKFTFYHEPLQTVMNKIARWYDVDIEYQGKVTTEEFVGVVPRSKNLSDVLHTLELTGLVHFKTIERRIIVMK